MILRTLSSLVLVVSLLGAPSLAFAANYEFCMVYHAQTIDSGNGEDHYVANTWWKSRGARARVRSVVWPLMTPDRVTIAIGRRVRSGETSSVE